MLAKDLLADAGRFVACVVVRLGRETDAKVEEADVYVCAGV